MLENDPMLDGVVPPSHAFRGDEEAGDALSDTGSDMSGGKVDVGPPEPPQAPFSFKKLWRYTGPGWLMSIAYLDPGNLESDLQAGVVAGYSLIWVLFWATVMGFFFQVLAARLGVVTGKDLAQTCRQEFPRPAAYTLWILTELAIIGSDIQEVIGSAIAMNILFGFPLWVGALITALDTFTIMIIHYYGVRKLEAVFGVLVGTMAVCFGVQFAIGRPDGVAIVRGLVVPEVRDNNLTQAVGMLGAVLMPHNIFLHSSLVLSRGVDRTSRAAVREANRYFAIESAISLAVSFLINLCVVAVFAKGFHRHESSKDIGLSNAGDYLRDAFGSSARYVWAVGLLAAGQSSTMTGTFAGQYVMQGFLDLKVSPWLRTFVTRMVALGPALTVVLAAHRQMDTLNEYLNVLQSIQLPFALLPILIFSTKRHIMDEFSLGRKARVVYWALCVLVVCTNIYLVVSFSGDNLPGTPPVLTALALAGTVYLGFVLYLVRHAALPHRPVSPGGHVRLVGGAAATVPYSPESSVNM